MRSSVAVDGVSVPYQLSGSGRHELVLVHGTGPGGEIAFGHLLDSLGEHFRIAMPDLSGSPTVTDRGGPLSVRMLADQVLGVVRHAGFTAPIVVGFSLGGPVSIAAAAAAPERIRGLVVVAGWLAAAHDEYLRLFFQTWQALADDPQTFGTFSTLTGFSPQHLASMARSDIDALVPNLAPSDALLRQVALGATLDVTEQARQVAVPTLVLANAHDATIPPHASHAVAEAIAGAQLTTLPSGHVVTLEQGELFVEALIQFARDCET